MAEFSFIRSSAGLLPADADGKEWMEKLRYGVRVIANVVVPRNPKFNRKFFAMLHVAYDNHDWPVVSYTGGETSCSFDRFRKDVTIQAGFYAVTCNTRGVVRKEAQSISFAKMDEAEFGQLYSAVLDVILAEFLTGWTSGDMDHAVDQMLSFA